MTVEERKKQEQSSKMAIVLNIIEGYEKSELVDLVMELCAESLEQTNTIGKLVGY